jgi:hypothetical protein
MDFTPNSDFRNICAGVVYILFVILAIWKTRKQQ